MKSKFNFPVKCKGGKIAEEKCGHYCNGGTCDLAEWNESWENDPYPSAEWPQKTFNRYTALTYGNSN